MSIKVLAKLFYRFDVHWVNKNILKNSPDIRMFVLLNHTSLFEPIFLAVIPTKIVWRMAFFAVFPGADITLNRPFVGRFFKILAPNVISISRNRDHTWDGFVTSLDSKSLIVIAPEGRMKRPTGLDRNGKAMTVRGGIADIISKIDSGKMVIVYSGGLHHVQTPGQLIPNIFKSIKVNFESCDIQDYKNDIGFSDCHRKFTVAMAKNLEARRDEHCPVT